MTRNQIDYQKHLETARSNRVSEAETERSHRESERLTGAALAETVRHNRSQEGIGYGNLLETSRHNEATEKHQSLSLDETIRHNTVAEAETTRHNTSIEGETARHNISTEKLGFQNLAETQRHNTAAERETNRHNLESEAIGDKNIVLGWANLAETTLRNTEQARHNLASETETARHNAVMEAKQWTLPETSVNVSNPVTFTTYQDVIQSPASIESDNKILLDTTEQKLLQPSSPAVVGDATHSSGKFTNFKREPIALLEDVSNDMKDEWNDWFVIP